MWFQAPVRSFVFTAFKFVKCSFSLTGIYLTVVMALTSVSVIMTVFILNLHYRGPNDRPVPGLLRWMFLRGKTKRGLHFNRDTGYVGEYYSDLNSHYIKDVPLRLTFEDLAKELNEELNHPPPENPPCKKGHVDSIYDNIHGFGQVESQLGRTSSQHKDAPLYQPLPTQQQDEYHRGSDDIVGTRSQKMGKTYEDIVEALEKIVTRYQQDDKEDIFLYEWRRVAAGVDKIFFWVFLVGTLVSTLIVLVIAPVTRFI